MDNSRIDNLIAAIETAEDPASVTNEMVAESLSILHGEGEDVRDAIADIGNVVNTEISERIAGDISLAHDISEAVGRIDEVTESIGAEKVQREQADSDLAAEVAAESAARQRLAADLAELRDFAEDTSRQVDGILDWKADVNDDLALLGAQKLDKSAIVTLSEAQYDALTEAQKNDGTIYLIYEDDTD